jgi:hypothetical protein
VILFPSVTVQAWSDSSVKADCAKKWRWLHVP